MHTELNRTVIAQLVHEFYDDVKRDSQLQPVFEAAIGNDWAPHLERMVEFWSTVMLATQQIVPDAIGKHMELGAVVPDHFQPWLSLFDTTARRLCTPELADGFTRVARGVVASVHQGCSLPEAVN